MCCTACDIAALTNDVSMVFVIARGYVTKQGIDQTVWSVRFFDQVAEEVSSATGLCHLTGLCHYAWCLHVMCRAVYDDLVWKPYRPKTMDSAKVQSVRKCGGAPAESGRPAEARKGGGLDKGCKAHAKQVVPDCPSTEEEGSSSEDDE